MKRVSVLTLIAVLMGAWLSVSFVRPADPEIKFSELILQLSGSRGAFALFGSLREILELTLRLLPYFSFQAVVGIWIYQNYCVASVYVFSRLPKRVGWYGRSAGKIAAAAGLFTGILLLAVWVVAAFRYEIVYDALGWKLLGYHLVLFTLWLFAATMLMNLVAIYTGSSVAYAIVTGGQILLISLFYLLQVSPNPEITAKRAAILRWNPATALVLGWQNGRWPVAFDGASPYPGLYAEHSVLVLLVLCLAVTAFGAALISRHDLLIVDVESGGV